MEPLARLIRQYDRRPTELTPNGDGRSGGLLAEPRVHQEGVSGVEGCKRRGERGLCPDGYGGRWQRAQARLRNSAASGHVAANAMRTRDAVSLRRAASFSNRSRMVANSALASG